MPRRCFFAQPIQNILTQRVLVYELLMREWDPDAARWRVPADFDVTPAALVAMLAQALAALDVHRVAINLTAAQFLDPAFEAAITDFAVAHMLPRELTVELTEFPGLAALQARSVGYRAAGVLIAIDDVGSDNPYAAVKDALPYVNTIKFALQNLREVGDRLSPRAIAALRFWFEQSEDQQMLFTFEGIESEADIDVAIHMGITRGQGYFFSPPKQPAAFSA